MRNISAVFLLFVASPSWSSPFAADAAVYQIHASTSSGGVSGTGVLIARDKVLTNCHVIEGARGDIRLTHRKTETVFTSTRFRQLGGMDACIVLGNFDGVPLPIAPQVNPGQSIWVFGYPESKFVAIQGTVKTLAIAGNRSGMVLAAFCAGGISGGPVVDVHGQLAGLLWGETKYSNHNECHAIPSPALLPYL